MNGILKIFFFFFEKDFFLKKILKIQVCCSDFIKYILVPQNILLVF